MALLGLSAFALECLGPEFSSEDGPQDTTGRAESPLLTANIFSKWCFSWMDRLMKKGTTEYITEKDLPGLVPPDEASALGSRLTKVMEKQCVPTLGKLLLIPHSSAVLLFGLRFLSRTAVLMRLPLGLRSSKMPWLTFNPSCYAGFCHTSRYTSRLVFLVVARLQLKGLQLPWLCSPRLWPKQLSCTRCVQIHAEFKIVY